MHTDQMQTDQRPPAPPRWVKVVALVVVLIIAIVVLVKVVGGGSHGPNRHVAPTSVADVD